MNEKRALIVEDTLNWAKQHQLSLSELGFKTSIANDYAEALGLLRREHFEMAVIDLSLTTNAEPENLNGVFLLEYLVEKNIPVIVVTGHGSRKLVDEIYQEFDVFEVLDKLSFNPEKFKEYVLQATNRTTDMEKKKLVSREKIEAFINELIKEIGTQSGQYHAGLRERQLLQTSQRLRVFISHSAHDKDLANRLANDLRTSGVDVWYDSDEINVGDSILEKIEQGAKSDFMVIILSPDALASWMVKQELVMFLNEERRRGHSLILPALYKECDIPPLLEGRRYADFRENYEKGLNELKKSLGISGSRGNTA
jgi:CheY-like chemotaxis protein